jgi:chromosomal replication initiator protein
MYLIKELLDLSLVEIGAAFGGRDHSTVIHSIRKVEESLETDSSLRTAVHRIRGSLSHLV